uniref:Family with sequence similarity 110 member C n=1 Tax=Catagonus wagneri TaxID=51154 RepID=A0A8C3W6H3_9CETA
MRALPALDVPANERLLFRDLEAPRARDAAEPARRSAVERLAADRAKYVRAAPGAGPGPAGKGNSPAAVEGQTGGHRPPACVSVPVARRAVARKPLRPDSLVIYRQKCEFFRGPGADSPRGSLVKKLFPGPGKDRTPPGVSRVVEEGRGEETARTEPGHLAAPTVPGSLALPESGPLVAAAPGVPAAPRDPELRAARRRGLQRSQSDLSSRCSASLAEFDSFFQYCGLEPEVVEALGRENFSAASDRVALKVRSVSVATSDSGFSRHSGGDEGLQEDELTEQGPGTTSVVERNARIIKWLYTCKKAREAPGQGLQGLAPGRKASQPRGLLDVCLDDWASRTILATGFALMYPGVHMLVGIPGIKLTIEEA